MTITEAKAFLTGLSPDKGQAEEYEGWKLNAPILRLKEQMSGQLSGYTKNRLIEYLFRRAEILESREVPDLKEKVKAAMLAAMDATRALTDSRWGPEELHAHDLKTYREFRALCAPEEVKP